MWVDFVGNNLVVTNDPTGVNNRELIPKGQISGVHPVGLNAKPAPPDDAYWIYPFPTSTIVAVVIVGPFQRNLLIELQNVVNKPTWSTGTQAGINQFVTDFAAFL